MADFLHSFISNLQWFYVSISIYIHICHIVSYDCFLPQLWIIFVGGFQDPIFYFFSCLRIALLLRRGRKMLWSEKSGPWRILVFIWFSDAITSKEEIEVTSQLFNEYTFICWNRKKCRSRSPHDPTRLRNVDRTYNESHWFFGFCPVFFDGPRMSKPRPS